MREGRESSFFQRVRETIREIPYGCVATYGQIAALAGNPRAARQVAWVLHSCSRKDNLPWHRVINSLGGISLKPAYGYEAQHSLLEKEGIEFDDRDRVDLTRYLYKGTQEDRKGSDSRRSW